MLRHLYNFLKKIRYDISLESSAHDISCLICLTFFEKAAKFEMVVCCKLKVALYGLTDCMLGTFACFFAVC